MKAIVALIMVLAIVGCAWAQSTTEAKPNKQSSDFAEWVMAKNNSVPIVKSFAQYFGLPTEPRYLTVFSVYVKNENDSKSRVYARRRDSGQIDLFFVVDSPTEGSKFYYAALNGILIKAAQAHGKIVPISNEDAQATFEHEKSILA
jgi:hypothetical protein